MNIFVLKLKKMFKRSLSIYPRNIHEVLISDEITDTDISKNTEVDNIITFNQNDDEYKNLSLDLINTYLLTSCTIISNIDIFIEKLAYRQIEKKYVTYQYDIHCDKLHSRFVVKSCIKIGSLNEITKHQIKKLCVQSLITCIKKLFCTKINKNNFSMLEKWVEEAEKLRIIIMDNQLIYF